MSDTEDGDALALKIADLYAKDEDELKAFLIEKTGGAIDVTTLSLTELQSCALSFLDTDLPAVDAIIGTASSIDAGLEVIGNKMENLGVDASPPPPSLTSTSGTSGTTDATPPTSFLEAAAIGATVTDAKSNDVEDWQEELIKEFMEITAATRQAAKGILEAFGYDMNGAMIEYMEHGAPATPPRPPITGTGAGTGSGFGGMGMDGGLGGLTGLQNPDFLSGLTGGTTGGAGDTNGPDEFDEFGMRRPDAIQHNQRLLSQRSDDSYDEVTGRAEEEAVTWMFEPPKHLSFVGNFEEAKKLAASDAKWLLVNIQLHDEFASHMLNRDTWVDETVEQVVRTSFIFWQRGTTSKNGKKFIQYYNLKEGEYPHICIIDPRTGAKIISYKGYKEPQELISLLVAFLEKNEGVLTKNKMPTPRDVKEQGKHFNARRGSDLPTNSSESGGEKENDDSKEGDAENLKEEAVVEKVGAVDYGLAPEEPAANGPDTCRIQIRLPNGKAKKRVFRNSDRILGLYAVVLQILSEEGLDTDTRFDVVTARPVRNLSECLEGTLGGEKVGGSSVTVSFHST